MQGNIRNYNVMRNILLKTLFSEKELEFQEFTGLNNGKDFENECQKELLRLGEEGLIIHTMQWSDYFHGGTVKGLTAEGKRFARCIQDDSVWRGVHETLKRSKLDISYPLIEKICERITERIVMSYIPNEFK